MKTEISSSEPPRQSTREGVDQRARQYSSLSRLPTHVLSLRLIAKSRARGARVKTAQAASRARGVLTSVSTLVSSSARSDESLISSASDDVVCREAGPCTTRPRNRACRRLMSSVTRNQLPRRPDERADAPIATASITIGLSLRMPCDMYVIVCQVVAREHRHV